MANLMKAAIFHGPKQPLRIEKVPVPEVGSEDILIEVKACGLCGSDVHYMKGETTPGKIPIILGHEGTGLVTEVGENVHGWKQGDRVVINCVTSCGSCLNCQKGRDSICLNRQLTGIHVDGALAEYIKVKPRNLISLPEKISFEQGALATDAVATPYHALKTRACLKVSESIAIFGLGGLGIHAVKLAKAMGAAMIIGVDVSESALERAKREGADQVVNPREVNPVEVIRGTTSGNGVDVALECIGKEQTALWAAESVMVGGRVVVVGLGPERLHLMSLTDFVRKEITLLGSSAFETKEIREILEMMRNG
jgi:propanol-preferring alcohol dehydrogenase